jgi:predicted ester cyclase
MALRIRKVGLSMTPDIKLTAERIPLEVINNGNFGLLDELLSTDYVDHTPLLGVAPTRDGLKQSLKALKTAFPNVRYTIENSVACGNDIVHFLKATGTMTGEFMGIAPTGKSATWNEIHIGRGVNGRLTEHWSIVDQLGMLVQLGVVPAPGRVAVTV